LFSYEDEGHRFTPKEVEILIAGIDKLKALDPAVGSGAFPMSILHKLVFILQRLDPRNEQWKERQKQRLRVAMGAAELIEDATTRENTLRELEQQVAGIEEALRKTPSTTAESFTLSKTASMVWTSNPSPCRSPRCGSLSHLLRIRK